MYNHLTREQRYAIYLGLQRKDSRSAIALQIGVSPSTVGREISRNSTKSGKYVWNKAHDIAVSRMKRTPGNRRTSETLRWRIEQLIMDEQWSPKQISGWLKKNKATSVSHETIYKMIRADDSGRLAKNCRHKMKYHRRHSKVKETKATNIRNRKSIHERPIEADGKRFGDWEMDLYDGKKYQLPRHGKVERGEKGHAACQDGVEVIVALQGRELEDYNNRQRQ